MERQNLQEGFNYSLAGDIRDPYPELMQKRKETPVEGENDAFIVYRYDDVARVLRDTETFSSKILGDIMSHTMGDHIMIGMDGARHRRHRALVSKAFSTKTLLHWENTLVENVVNTLIDRFATLGKTELVREFTYQFPTLVIARILGLPQKDFSKFQRWSMSIINVMQEWEEGVKASHELKAYLKNILDIRRKHPENDLISELVIAELEGEKLSDEEIFSFLLLLLPAGVETTFRATGNLIFALLTHPEQYQAILSDQNLIPQAIEEVLRWEPPLLTTSRVATRDVTIKNVQIPAGSMVSVNLGSANRDETVFPAPDKFDIFRQSAPHIAFGYGPHLCLGLHLARMEIRVAISGLLKRLPNLRLDSNVSDPHIHGMIFRSPTSLPVLFDPMSSSL